MAKFKKGDAIYHPINGVGIVQQVKRRRQDGKIQEYYIIQLLDRPKSTQLETPVEGAEEVGLQKIPSKSKFPSVKRLLSGRPRQLDDHPQARARKIRERIREGGTVRLGSLVRDLAFRDTRKGLTARDRSFLEEAQGRLAAMHSAARGIQIEQARDEVDARVQERREAWEKRS